MVLLVIALFMAGILIGIQIDEFFQKDDLKKEYDRGYDNGWLEADKQYTQSLEYYNKPFFTEEELNSDEITPPPTPAFESPVEFLQEFERFLNENTEMTDEQIQQEVKEYAEENDLSTKTK